jgi:hypothetical protein
MKAKAPTSQQTVLQVPVQEFFTTLRSLGFNVRRDVAFCQIAESLQAILDSRPIIKRTTATTDPQTPWLNDAARLDPTWKRRIHAAHRYALCYQACLKVSLGPSQIVMMVLLVFEFHEKLPAPRLSDALHTLRMVVRKETINLM